VEGVVVVSFLGTVSAGGELTLVSRRITFPFRTWKLRVFFPLNTNRTVRVSFFLSPDSSAPITGKPTGQNLFSAYSAVDYIVGDDEMKELEHVVDVKEIGQYVKVYARNTDAFPHTVDAQVMIIPTGT